MDAMRLKLTDGLLCDVFLLKVFMKTLLLIFTLISFNLYAGDNCADCGVIKGKLIKDDARICAQVERNNFKQLKRNLKRYYNTTLKESYFDIECDEGDLLNMVIEAPTDVYFISLHLQRYFEERENDPEMFSRILNYKIDGRNAIRRIEKELHLIRQGTLAGTEYEKKLVKLKNKFTLYLKKHPVAGSAESLSSQ